MFRGKGGEDSEVMDYLYSRIENLPDTCAEWIVDNFRTYYDRIPPAMDDAILSMWQKYRNAHPEQKTSASMQSSCTKCEHGMLHLRSPEGLVYAYRCSCGSSDASQMIPQVRLEDMLAKGWVLDSIEEAKKWIKPPKEIRREVKRPSKIPDVDLAKVIEELEALRLMREQPPPIEWGTDI